MTTPDFNKDLLSEIFGERPELAFQGYLAKSGLGQPQQQFMGGKASDFLTMLQQAVGKQMAGGALPTLTPESFFGGMDFKNEMYQNYGREQRGMGTSQFSPFTQFRYGR